MRGWILGMAMVVTMGNAQAAQLTIERIFDGASLSGPTPVKLKASPDGTRGDALALDEALERLRAQDARKGEIVELTYLLGLTREEIAEVIGVSVPTVDRELRFARAWLKQKLAA